MLSSGFWSKKNFFLALQSLSAACINSPIFTNIRSQSSNKRFFFFFKIGENIKLAGCKICKQTPLHLSKCAVLLELIHARYLSLPLLHLLCCVPNPIGRSESLWNKHTVYCHKSENNCCLVSSFFVCVCLALPPTTSRLHIGYTIFRVPYRE